MGKGEIGANGKNKMERKVAHVINIWYSICKINV
jgi:hypothetical protein